MESNAEKRERLNALSGQILDAAIEVHRVLGGPGLLEKIYEEALTQELSIRGINVERQVPIPIAYKGHTIKHPLFLDLFIEQEIIIEVKSVEKFNPIFSSQLLTYLRLTGKSLGLIINFGAQRIKDGFYRTVNDFP